MLEYTEAPSIITFLLSTLDLRNYAQILSFFAVLQCSDCFNFASENCLLCWYYILPCNIIHSSLSAHYVAVCSLLLFMSKLHNYALNCSPLCQQKFLCFHVAITLSHNSPRLVAWPHPAIVACSMNSASDNS